MAQMPMRICHPPMDAADWATRPAPTPELAVELPQRGHWPSLLWFYGSARLLLHGTALPEATSCYGADQGHCWRVFTGHNLNQLPRASNGRVL